MTFLRCARPLIRPGRPRLYTASRRHFFDLASDARHPVQVYLTRCRDPYLNLSVEHHLLQTSHPDSTVLFIYANDPCVVMGRNQNPWLEVDLALLRRGVPDGDDEDGGRSRPIQLVRRRSGGGAVFHDAGNVNWSVICPPAAFDRDRHAEMVVRALRGLGVATARVNARHDIVVADDDHHQAGEQRELKVSGSAYKLTRLRSLHHGTCLLSSPNLGLISPLFRSPAEPYIKARGVESVRSRIRNVGLPAEAFTDAVVGEFTRMYGGKAQVRSIEEDGWDRPPTLVKGYDELKSPEWIYGQTPQFTFSTHPSEADPRTRQPPPEELPADFRASFTARHGKIHEMAMSGLQYREALDVTSQDQALSGALDGLDLHRIRDWGEALRDASPVPLGSSAVGSWLNRLFGL